MRAKAFGRLMGFLQISLPWNCVCKNLPIAPTPPHGGKTTNYSARYAKNDGRLKMEFDIPIDIYGCSVKFFVTHTSKMGPIADKYNLDLTGHWLARCYCRESDWKLPVILVFKSDKVYPGIIAHETLHAAIHILAQTGYRLDPLNDEPLAYLHSYIFDNVFQAIYHEPKKRKF